MGPKTPWYSVLWYSLYLEKATVLKYSVLFEAKKTLVLGISTLVLVLTTTLLLTSSSKSQVPDPQPPPPAVKRRMGREAAALGITAHQARYSPPTLQEPIYYSPQEEVKMASSRRLRAMHATEVEVQHMSFSLRMDLRAGVRYIFCGVYGMPPRDQ